MDTVKQAQSIVGYSKGRPEHDFYPTPPEMTQALLDNYKFERVIWEPACGDGAMSKVLRNNGYYVLETDLIDRGLSTAGCMDFLKSREMYTTGRTIITNPPYKLAEKFVYKAFEIGCEKLALLCKLAFLEGQSRKVMFELYPPEKVLVFSKRQTMTRNGEPSRNGGMIAYAWFIWDFNNINCEPKIGWI